MKIIIRESQSGVLIRGVILEEKRISDKRERIISESGIEDSVIINVDIQPEYEKYITFNMGRFYK